MRKSVFLVALVLTAGAVTVACIPPPPPATPRYAPCGTLNLEPFQCEIRANAWAGTTWATMGARTTEPPTHIFVVMRLEQLQPDGTWTVKFTDDRGGGVLTQGRSEQSAVISCEPGAVYRWYLNVVFASHPNTTYTATSDTVRP